jgi:hypothetical protein
LRRFRSKGSLLDETPHGKIFSDDGHFELTFEWPVVAKSGLGRRSDLGEN